MNGESRSEPEESKESELGDEVIAAGSEALNGGYGREGDHGVHDDRRDGDWGWDLWSDLIPLGTGWTPPLNATRHPAKLPEA
jgi:hypothetical protein